MPSRTASFKSSIALCLYVLLLPLTLAQAASTGSGGIEPVITSNFPDPCLAREKNGGTWWAFSTHSDGINVQAATSPDFAHWTLHQGYDALPTLPSWALPSDRAYVWAPDVNAVPSGKGWVMYFAAKTIEAPRKHCIGAATSPTISGPYTPLNYTLVCDLDQGGNIDPSLFADPHDGKYYLVYKVDGNTIGHGGACGNTKTPVAPTPIYRQEFSGEDLVTPIGDPVFLINNLDNDGFRYDGANTERPSVAYRNGTYYLLYNAHCFADLAYRIDYISCINGKDTHTGIAGCNWQKLKAVQQRKRERVLLKTSDSISGTSLVAPGSMHTSADSHKVVFHGDTNLAWFSRKPGDKIRRVRAMYAADILYDAKKGNLKVLGLYGER